MNANTTIDRVENPFLSGNFAPVTEEHVQEITEISGEIPKDLNGHFLRIGPNPLYVADPAVYHIFDGDGMIHAVEFDNGRATYRNRYVETEGLKLERAKGSWIWKGLAGIADVMAGGEPPVPGMPKKTTANTAMVYHNETLYALMEAGAPYKMTLPDLGTVGEEHYDGKLTHAFTAHPKVDPSTGEMIAFGASPFPPFVSYIVVSPAGEIVHSTPITIPKGVFMHDIGITERYTVFADMPLTYDLERAKRGGQFLDWEPENGSRLGVMPRFGTDADIKWFTVDTSILFHVANAWEEGDEVVLQAPRALRSEVSGLIDEAGTNEGRDDQRALLYEWRLNMTTGAVRERFLDRVQFCEFPRINEDYIGRPSRYIYAPRGDAERPFLFDAILKYDDQTNSTQVHHLGKGRFGGEGIFAKRDGATAEDDGYVILFVWDDNLKRSECLIIDAQNFDGPPVAKLVVPYRVPFGFHAGWVGTAELPGR